nr:retrovirus-related Pol polyprotein from transposon TNT 1-94 [Tanacetum cinerariifolium]
MESLSPQVVFAAKLPILNPNEFDLWNMRIEQYFLMTDYSLWEVILNGDSTIPTRVVDGLMFNFHKDAKTLMDPIEKRFEGNTETKKKLISQLEIHGVSLSQEDVNLKFLRSLPSEWRTHTLIWRNKTGLEEHSLDDLFNSLKIYKAEVKSYSSVSTTTQNIAFVSSSNTDSTTELVSAATSVSAVSAKLPVSSLPNMDSLSNAIDANDLEEMDLKWQMAMKGHFARECRSPKDSRRNGNAEPHRRNVPVKTSTSNALVSQCDSVGSYDWSFQAEEEPTNYALIVFSSSSSYYDNEVVSFLKACLESVEARHLVYKQNEYVFEEDINLLKLEVQLRDNALVNLRQTLEKAEQEKDALKLKLEKFQICWSDESLPPSPIYDSPTKPDQDLSHTIRPSAPIIEDWVSDSEDESETKTSQNVPSFVWSTEQVKSPRHYVHHVETSIPPKTAIPKPTSNGKRRNRKACFVCKSLDHLIKDCDYHKKKMSKPVSITAIRPVSTAVPKASVTRLKQVKTNVTKTNSPPNRHTNRSTSPKVSNSPPIVTAVKALVVSDAQGLQGNWEWKPKCPILDHVSHNTSALMTLKRLHMDLFGPTFVKSLNKKSYSLVVIDDYSRFTWVFFLATKDETSPILKTFITGLENQLSFKVEFSVPRTLQQNGIAERKNRTLIEAARIMLADSLLSIPFWAEAVNTACYVQNRVLVIKPHNKTLYELLHGRTPSNQSNPSVGFQEKFDAEKAGEESDQQYVLFSVWSSGSTNPQNTDGHAAFDEKKPESEVNVSPSSSAESKKQDDKTKREAKGKIPTVGQISPNNINTFSVAGPSNAAASLTHRKYSCIDASQLLDDPEMPELEDITYSNDEDDVGAEADFNNLETSITVHPILTTGVHKDHHVLVDLPYGKRAIGTKWGFRNKKDERGIVVRNKARLVIQGHTQEEGINYEEVFNPVARIEDIRLFLAYASFMGFMVYQMDVKSAFLYGTIKEEIYVCQPPGFEDPDHPEKVYKAVKALYGLHQAPRAWYETLANYLLENGFQRGKIDQTLFIKRQKDDILFVQIYVDDIIFVKQKKDGIFIRQDKYVAKILKKFRLTEGKSASTPIDKEKPLLKDPDGEDVDVHTYRSMIGSLIYLTSSRPDIMFAQIVVATASTEAEYVAVSSCCAKVLWIQNQLLDYSPDQMVSGKDSTNPLMTDNLPKIVWCSTHHVTLIKNWLVQKQTALGVNTPRCDEDRVEYMELTVFLLPKVEKVRIGVSDVDLQESAVRLILLLLVQKFVLFGLTNWCCSLSAVSSIKYALTVNPNIYVSCIKQFWTTVAVKKVNDVIRLQALVDKKKVVVTEATIREVLRLDDAEGVECDLSTHTIKYTSPALTHKVFANMRRVGKGFSWVETPLFEGMLVAYEVGEGVADEVHDEGVPAAGIAAEGDVSAANDEVPTVADEPSIPSPTPPTPPPRPSQDIPSTSQTQPTPPQSPQVQPPSPQPQPQPTQDAANPMNFLQEKVGTTQKVETFDKTMMDDVSNQERLIAEMDQDADVVLENDKEVDESEPAEVQEVVDFVTTAKIITEVVTAASENITAPSTTITAAEAQVPAATLTAAPARVTVAPNRRRKGVVIRDPHEESTTSTIIPAETKSKDKGKGILEEEPKPLKKQAQIKQDEQYARELEAELNRTIDWDETKEQIEEEESRALKRINETPVERAAKRQKLDEEVEELKRHLQIVPNEDDDVYTEAILLSRKVLVVSYEIIKHNNKPFYKIIRVDGTRQLYISFLTLLRNFDREDLEALWSLVKERFATAKPKNFSDDFLLITLRAMFEKPDIHAQTWKNQRSVHGPAKFKGWKLLESCCMQIFTFTTTHQILLVERKYPLTRFTLDQMLNAVRLEVEEESEVSLEMLRFVRQQHQEGAHLE